MQEAYYVSRDGARYGPYSRHDLQCYLADCRLSASDLGWRDGLADWKPLAELLGLPPAPRAGNAPLSPTFTGAPARRSAHSNGHKRGVLAIVCWLLGLLGVHRFVVGRVGSGVAQLLLSITLIGLVVSGIWVFIDFVLILAGKFTDNRGHPIEEWW
jgi:TM2 domain/GYF domain 2